MNRRSITINQGRGVAPIGLRRALFLCTILGLVLCNVDSAGAQDGPLASAGRVIYAEDFTHAAIGKLAPPLELMNGTAEVAERDERRWIQVTQNSQFRLVLPDTLPADFTLTLDYLDPGAAGGLWIYFTERRSSRLTHARVNTREGALWGGGVAARGRSVEPLAGRAFEVRLVASEGRVQLEMDGAVVAKSEDANLGQSAVIEFRVTASELRPVLIGNLRVTTGTVQYAQIPRVPADFDPRREPPVGMVSRLEWTRPAPEHIALDAWKPHELRFETQHGQAPISFEFHASTFADIFSWQVDDRSMAERVGLPERRNEEMQERIRLNLPGDHLDEGPPRARHVLEISSPDPTRPLPSGPIALTVIARDAAGTEIQQEIELGLTRFRNDRPKVVVLMHGMTTSPHRAEEQRIGTLRHGMHYWGYSFVAELLGGDQPFLWMWNGPHGPPSDSITDRHWTRGAAWHTFPTPGPDIRFGPFVSRDPVQADAAAGLPSGVMLTYRDGSRELGVQAAAAIDQIYAQYQRLFGHLPPFDQPQLVLLGHSKGGLVGRHILTNPEGNVGGHQLTRVQRERADFIRERALYLITLATPHEGSPAADLSIQIGDKLDSVVPTLSVILNAKGLDADLPTTSHTRTAFWTGLNRGALAPHRMRRPDGTLIPLYALTGRTPSAGFFSDANRFGATPGVFSDSYFILREGALVTTGTTDWERELRRMPMRIAGQAWDLMKVDLVVETLGAGWGNLPPGGDQLDRTRRSFKESDGVIVASWPDPFHRFPALYLRDMSDGRPDNDGLVSATSGLGYTLGSGINEFFAHDRTWSVDGREISGSWYRLFRGPWDWQHHGSIMHHPETARSLRYLIEDVGPLVRIEGRSYWPLTP